MKYNKLKTKKGLYPMLDTIKEAAENFCIHQLGATPTLSQEEIVIKSDMYIVSLDITTQEEELYRIYFIAEKDFIQNIATAFLEEELSDEETLEDMALECINLIVGNAKVIASEKEKHFTIATPNLLENSEFLSNIQEYFTLSCNEKNLYVAMQKQ